MAFDYAEFSASFPWFFPVVAFIFGAVVGSFLNVCIYRIPRKASVVTPGSHCACGKPIAWHDNIPILSWFILRGKARCCGRPYSFRYPLVEALTGALFLACWLAFPPAKAVCGMFFVGALICATFIDLDTFEIPDLFSLWLGMAGLVLAFFVPSLHGQYDAIAVVASVRSLTIALKGLLIGAGLVYMICELAFAILKKEGMGLGDVKLVAAIGAFCGWEGTLTALFGGAILGSLWFAAAYVWQLASGKKIEVKAMEEGEGPQELGMKTQIPFGPSLAAAGLLHFLYLHQWVNAYFGEIAAML